MDGYIVAVVGATGAVGTKMIEMLETTNFPIKEVKLLASSRSAGKTAIFKNQELTISETTPESFNGVDIALFSAGGDISKKFAPEAVKRGAIVVDNTSAYRMDQDVPLVVPEVNREALKQHKGIIANPNCSTIQMIASLGPIRNEFGLERIIVSTYQAVSGAGNEALKELKEETRNVLDGKSAKAAILPVSGDKKHFPIAFNVLPQIDLFGEGDYTNEEWKMVNETKKILSDQDIKISATCVRVPVVTGHAESVYIEVGNEKKASVEAIRQSIRSASGVVLMDNPTEQIYPTPLEAENKKETFVGRIRKDLDIANGYHFWVVSDNLLKGAALNSVQIVEQLHNMNLIKK
ncbi:MAG: aspartate-semialdehyde dehydrogenase [Pisciglobus halotolerans]|nr:aspartate-semialdehyde dehydrogenase [Pisciglobus halotolerans]